LIFYWEIRLSGVAVQGYTNVTLEATTKQLISNKVQKKPGQISMLLCEGFGNSAVDKGIV